MVTQDMKVPKVQSDSQFTKDSNDNGIQTTYRIFDMFMSLSYAIRTISKGLQLSSVL